MVASGLRRGRARARSGAAGLPPAHHRFTGTGRAPPRPRAAAQGLAAEADPGPPGGESAQEPLLLRAARGEAVERPPAWMMRQAGRYMKVYQDLCKRHTSFRERSETVDLVVDISLQPIRAFKPDGCILFSDILTPLQGMNVPFDFKPGVGPIIASPIRTPEAARAIRRLRPEESMGFVGESLQILRRELPADVTQLGFVGAPYTLATYLVEGGTSRNYTTIKEMAFQEPELLHGMLQVLAESMADYVRYQADMGAQVVQVFDSWGGTLTPLDFDAFSAPYLKYIFEEVKKTHPDLPLILYISGSAGLLERLPALGMDIVSLDHSVDMAEARARMGNGWDGKPIGVQGNLDPAVLVSGSRATIEDRVDAIARKAQGTKHILNLGHGVMPSTPEDKVAMFFEATRTVNDRL